MLRVCKLTNHTVYPQRTTNESPRCPTGLPERVYQKWDRRNRFSRRQSKHDSCRRQCDPYPAPPASDRGG